MPPAPANKSTTVTFLRDFKNSFFCPISLKEMIQTIADSLNIVPKINQLPMQPGDVDRTYADISKAKRLINYSPTTSLKDGINKFVLWYKENRNLYNN